jgi:cytochrome d ubiquinol oxidase subunit II
MSVVDEPRRLDAAASLTGRIAMILYWVFVLAISTLLYVLLDGFDLGVGILFGLTRERDAAARHDERRRADLGRQRDLARGDRRRALGRLSDRLCDAALGLLSSALVYARRPDPARRRVRVPLQDRADALDLGRRLRRRIACRRLHPGHDGRRACRGSSDRQWPYVGGEFGWLSPFALLCAASASASATRCSAPAGSSGNARADVRDAAYRLIPYLSIGLLVFLIAVFATRSPRISRSWAMARAALSVRLSGIGVQRRSCSPRAFAGAATGARSTWSPLIFAAAFGTLAISFWPYMIPFSITIEEAAAPHSSLAFMFWGEGLFVFPLMLIYTAISYTRLQRQGHIDGGALLSAAQQNGPWRDLETDLLRSATQ